MASANPDLSQPDPRPPLWHDISYHGMNFTQFFGAFNDNLFKQLVLLICVDYFLETGKNDQWAALLLFALPFVLFSGFAGYLSDRMSKVHIVVAMKVAEIGVMTAGLLALHSTDGRMIFLLAVVFLMGTHSAFFGPPKYGILPELFRERDLPQVNGMIQMTTFLSIILGMALAGFIKEWYNDRLWIGSAVCIGIAVTGTLTSLVIRRTPIARAGTEVHAVGPVRQRRDLADVESRPAADAGAGDLVVVLVSGRRDSAFGQRLRQTADELRRWTHKPAFRLHGRRHHGRLSVGWRSGAARFASAS